MFIVEYWMSTIWITCGLFYKDISKVKFLLFYGIIGCFVTDFKDKPNKLSKIIS